MVTVLKASGEIEPFSEDKLLLSIKRAGIPQKLHTEVISHVKSTLYNRIPTSEIYNHIQEYLGKTETPYEKAKYSLKKAIMELGPTGFPFEVYVAEILKTIGFHTEVGRIMTGKCVNHEIDILASKEGRKVLVECKFHNTPGTRSNLHVSLYTKARFDDLKDKHGLNEALLVTNTKITSDALSYALCENIKVISWSYPEGESLRDLIEKYRLYPLTQLSFLSLPQKQELLSHGIVLIKQICSDPGVLNKITIPENKREEIMKEASSVCRL